MRGYTGLDVGVAGDSPASGGSLACAPAPLFAAGAALPGEAELRTLSPEDLPWGHRSVIGLADAMILIVDEDPADIEATASFLSAVGYRRLLRVRAEEALAVMRREAPALLLLCLGGSGVSGFDVLSAMREDAVLQHVPVIALESCPDLQAKARALSLGAADFLARPVDPCELALRVRNVLAANAYREYIFQHDALTGLPNKWRYRQATAQVLADATAQGHSGALLHVGVDALGRVNDALGRSVGDQLVQRIARRLASCVQTESGGELASERHQPMLYRFDGDEFGIIVPYVEGVHSAASFISKLLEDGTASFHPHGAPELFVTCSIGVSLFPRDGLDPDTLMRNAGLALRHAKQAGAHRYEFYAPDFGEQAQDRLDLGADLRHAVRRDQLELLYEPVLELATGRLAGAQTLVRWRHGSGRVIEGDALMDLAAHCEMDVALTEWVVDQLRKHVRNWRAAGLQPVPLGVKASLAHMQLRDLVHLLQAAIGAGIEPRTLSIEVDHVGFLQETPRKDTAALAALRAKGLRIALGRFGAGGTIAQLRQLACDEIRVDGSFLRDVEKDPVLQAMLLGINDLSKRLRLTSVACGVDTAQKLDFLRKHGWDRAQGRFFGEPLEGLVFAAKWLTRSGKPQRVSMPGELA